PLTNNPERTDSMKQTRNKIFLPCIVAIFIVAGAVLADAQEIYVLEGMYQQAKVVHLFNGSENEITLAGNGNALPQGMAVDNGSGKMYWVDATHAGAQVRFATAGFSV